MGPVVAATTPLQICSKGSTIWHLKNQLHSQFSQFSVRMMVPSAAKKARCLTYPSQKCPKNMEMVPPIGLPLQQLGNNAPRKWTSTKWESHEPSVQKPCNIRNGPKCIPHRMTVQHSIFINFPYQTAESCVHVQPENWGSKINGSNL